MIIFRIGHGSPLLVTDEVHQTSTSLGKWAHWTTVLPQGKETLFIFCAYLRRNVMGASKYIWFFFFFGDQQKRKQRDVDGERHQHTTNLRHHRFPSPKKKKDADPGSWPKWHGDVSLTDWKGGRWGSTGRHLGDTWRTSYQLGTEKNKPIEGEW